jgi:hypothetical protein
MHSLIDWLLSLGNSGGGGEWRVDRHRRVAFTRSNTASFHRYTDGAKVHLVCDDARKDCPDASRNAAQEGGVT